MNDEFYARYAAYRLGLPVEVLSIPWLNKPASVFSCLEKQDEPLGIFSFVPLSQMMQKVHENARVVLTGDGGDEVLLGYGQTDNWLGGDPHGEDRPWDIGPPPPQWMSAWGRRAVGADLAGHGFVKVDRTSAENAVESRAPFLDWDLVTYLRSLPAGYLLAGGKSKSLVHSYLAEFPSWFLNRPKIGFKIHLRWMLAASNFSGMRDLVSNETVARFSKYLPQSLDKPAVQWRTRDIFNAFPLAWRLLAWSQYEKRLREVRFLCG